MLHRVRSHHGGSAIGAPPRAVELEVDDGLRLPESIPGVAELNAICANATRIGRLCEIIGIRPGAEASANAKKVGHALIELPPNHHHHGPPDGAFLEPELN